MSDLFFSSLGLVAPMYNIAFVVISLILFLKLFSIKNRSIFIKPWVYLFLAVIIFIVEEIVTVLLALGISTIPHFIFGFFEMAMISLFIYMVLLQKEYVNKLGSRQAKNKK